MTGWRGEAGGHDAFEQEIEDLLAVEPAPAWTASVRGRFSAPSPGPRAAGTLTWAAALVVVALGGAVLWQRVVDRPPQQIPLASVAPPTLQTPRSPVEIVHAPSAPSGTNGRSVRVGRRRTPTFPIAMTSPGDARAFAQLLETLADPEVELLMDATQLQPATPLPVPASLTVDAIAIDPWTDAAARGGEEE